MPQHSGIAKIKNQYLAKTYQTMLHAKNVLGKFLVECMKTASHVTNRPLQLKLGFMSLFEKLWKTKPIISLFHVFACMCYVFVTNHKRIKFNKKSIKRIFLGYNS